MNPIEAALVDLCAFLDERRVPYAVIGGFANLHWGRPRLTEDLDVTVRVPEEQLLALIESARRRFRLLASSPLEFARETRVVPLATASGVRADVILAGHPWEDEVIRRARSIPLAGRPVRLCAPEDLVLLKLVSGRARDREDVEGVIVRQGAALDRGYLDPKIRELAAGLERPEILDFYAHCLDRAGLR